MNKRIKMISMMMATVVGASVFAGCGSKTTDTGEKKADSGKEIVVWSNLMDNEVEELDKIAQEWAEKNNKKVKVLKDDAGMQEFLTAANSAKGPDMLFGLPHNNIGTFQKAGLLEEIPSGFLNKDDYVDANIWDAVTFGGKEYAVPISMETSALFYNKDKVKDIPKTMDELVKKGKEYGPTGLQFPINDFYYVATFLQSYGGYIFGTKDGSYDVTDIGLNNEGAVKAYQYLQDLVQKDKLMTADTTQDIANSLFGSQDAIFYIGGPWDVSGFTDNGVNFGVTAIPEINGQGAKSLMGVQTAFVSSKSQCKDDDWDLMKYLIENSGEKLYEVGNRIPVLKSELEKDAVKNNEYTQGFLAQLKYAVPMPNVSEGQSIWDASKNVQRILSGEDPKAVADDFQKAMQDAINVAQ